MATWQCRAPECAWRGRWYECPWDGFLYLFWPHCGAICDPVSESSTRPCVGVWYGSLLGLLLGLVVLLCVWSDRAAETVTMLTLVGGTVGWIEWGLLLTRE